MSQSDDSAADINEWRCANPDCGRPITAAKRFIRISIAIDTAGFENLLEVAAAKYDSPACAAADLAQLLSSPFLQEPFL